MNWVLHIRTSVEKIDTTIRDFLVCTLLSFVFLHPLILNMTSHVPTGDGSRDAFQFLWNFWWTGQALFNGELDIYFTNFLFFPDGTSLLFHTLSIGNGVVSIPMQILWGGIAGLVGSLNVLTFLHFVLVGLGVCLIARHLGASDLGCYTGSVLAMFLPFRIHHLNHINLISHGWLILCLYFVLQESKTSHWRNCIFAAAFAILTFYSDHGLALQLLLSGVFVVFFHYKKEQWKSIVSMIAYGLLGCVPFFLAFQKYPLDEFIQPQSIEAGRLSSNMLSVFMPASNEWVFVENWHIDFLEHGVLGNEPSLGLAMIIGLLVSVQRTRVYIKYICIGGFFLLLSLGPILHIGFHSFDIWMPFDMIQNTSVLSMMRAPVRFVSVASIFLSIAVAIGMRQRSVHIQWGLFLLIILLRFPSAKIPMTEVSIPEHVYDLSKDKREYAILHSPVYYRYKQTYMMWQTVHGHPISTGYSARKWRKTGSFFKEIEKISDINTYFDTANSKQVYQDGFGVWFQHNPRIEKINEFPQSRWFIPEN
jgi:hypothetical protein